jgi:hypothetical protein
MASAPYFRRQSELCARLALASTDEEWTKRFSLLSLQYLAKALELEQASTPPEPPDDSSLVTDADEQRWSEQESSG